VAGFYYFDDQTPGPGYDLKLLNNRWRGTFNGQAPLFTEASISDTIVMEYGGPVDRILTKVPAVFCGAGCDQSLYHPEDRVIRAAPSRRVVNRYGPL
jgi:hypothetical protein